MGKKKVLFLCTGNACRSQMAEGFAQHHGKDLVDVCSAGIAPVGVHPFAIEVMGEAGVDISAHSSDALSMELLQDMDMIITLCGDARENCPLVPAKMEKRHWPLPDPAKAEGNAAAVLHSFRAVRDEIEERVLQLLEEMKGE